MSTAYGKNTKNRDNVREEREEGKNASGKPENLNKITGERQ